MTWRAPLFALLGALALSACGDDDAIIVPDMDSGTDAHMAETDSGPAPMCGSHHCGSPLVGEPCCTTAADVSAGVAVMSGHCGASLESVVSALAGQCVQLRQPGSLDVRCPGRAIGGQLEPGCCTSLGVCGTWNAAADLGCQRLFDSDRAPMACSPSGVDAGDTIDAGT